MYGVLASFCEYDRWELRSSLNLSIQMMWRGISFFPASADLGFHTSYEEKLGEVQVRRRYGPPPRSYKIKRDHSATIASILIISWFMPSTSINKRPRSDDEISETIDHRKRRRNRTTQSCLNCHGSKRLVGDISTFNLQMLTLTPSVTGAFFKRANTTICLLFHQIGKDQLVVAAWSLDL